MRLQKALYTEGRAYKDVCIHTAHPACARLTPNIERTNHRTNCNIPYTWIFWSSRGYNRARHAGKKWRGEFDHPWERGWYTPKSNQCKGKNQIKLDIIAFVHKCRAVSLRIFFPLNLKFSLHQSSYVQIAFYDLKVQK